MIGGYAVVVHGHSRSTGDLDIFIERSPENAAAVCTAYHEFGLGRGEVTPEDFLSDGRLIRAGVEPLRLEVLNRISGVEFAQCYERRILVDVDGLKIAVIGREDLIANKLATGRVKDLLDVRQLTKGEQPKPRLRRRRKSP
jgi:predicted nucleotidyltransferase